MPAAPVYSGVVARGVLWRVFVPVVCLLAGALFAVSAQTARGTDLRGAKLELSQLISASQDGLHQSGQQRDALAAEVAQMEDDIAAGDAGVAAAQAAADAVAPAAGLTPLHGPGLEVALDDAELPADGTLPPGVRPDDVVIHQSDVQAVVNAMWAAGADAMAIMDQRIISTSAVRCVGNTLLLQGRTYSPPFTITAIGDPTKLADSLETAPGMDLLLDAVDYFDLGYDVTTLDDVTLPAYDGPLGIDQAQPAK